MLGSVIFAWAGEVERAIEWAERGLRLSPFDPYRSSAFRRRHDATLRQLWPIRMFPHHLIQRGQIAS
jgi:hypothetical protein